VGFSRTARSGVLPFSFFQIDSRSRCKAVPSDRTPDAWD
jgi:hypothetical protein